MRVLPFVRDRLGMERDYWAPQSNFFSGDDYGSDCELGQRYAEAYMRMREEVAPDGEGLQHIVLDMLSAPPSDVRRGLIVGFFAALDEALRVAAVHGGVATLARIRRQYLEAMVRSNARPVHGAVDVAGDEAA